MAGRAAARVCPGGELRERSRERPLVARSLEAPLGFKLEIEKLDKILAGRLIAAAALKSLNWPPKCPALGLGELKRSES